MSLPPMPPVGGPTPWPVEPRHSNRRPWIIVVVSFAVVVALVVGLLVWQSGSSGDRPATQSADDGVDRTVGLLTEKDPVCDGWRQYADKFAAELDDWYEIDKSIAAAHWTPEQRMVVDRASEAMVAAADQFESFLPLARSIVLQELIVQSIVYWRAFVDRIPHYVEEDRRLAGIAGNFGSAVTYMCVIMRMVQAKDLRSDVNTSGVAVPMELVPLIAGHDHGCANIIEMLELQNVVLRGWTSGDPSVPAHRWTPEERKLNLAAKEYLAEDVKKARSIADNTDNPKLKDLVNTYASYLDAYTQVIENYEPDDDKLWKISTYLGGGLSASCKEGL